MTGRNPFGRLREGMTPRQCTNAEANAAALRDEMTVAELRGSELRSWWCGADRK